MDARVDFRPAFPNLSARLLSVIDRNGPTIEDFVRVDVSTCGKKQFVKEAGNYRNYLEYLRETFMTCFYSSALWSIPAFVVSAFVTDSFGPVYEWASYTVTGIVILVAFISGFCAYACDRQASRVTRNLQQKELDVIRQSISSARPGKHDKFLFWPGWLGALFALVFTPLAVIVLNGGLHNV